MIIKLHNLFHFSHLIFLDPVYSEHILQYSQPILLFREELDERSPGLKIMEPEFLLALPLQADFDIPAEYL